jgi:hypothetical protein
MTQHGQAEAGHIKAIDSFQDGQKHLLFSIIRETEFVRTANCGPPKNFRRQAPDS